MRGPRIRPVHVLIVAVALIVTVLAVSAPRPIGAGIDVSGGVPETPTLAVTPTPNEPPLARGQRLLADGDYAGAEAALKPLIGASDAAVDRPARLALARALLADGKARDAADVLAALEAAYPGSAEADSGQFYQGRALDALGDNRAAVAAYRAYAARHPSIAPYVNLEIAASLRAAGDLAGAEAAASAAAGATVIRRAVIAALEQVRAIQRQRLDDAGYLATTERLLRLATLSGYRAELTFEAATAERALGQQSAATEGFRAVITSSPTSSYAAQALAALDQMGASGSLLREQRGMVDVAGGQYQAAINVLTEALQVNPNSDLAWYYRALARLRAGDDATAAAEFRELVARYPQSPYAATALYRAGMLLEEQGQFDAARAAFQTLRDAYPMASEAGDAGFQAGFAAFLAGNTAAAEAAWTGETDGRAAFWLAKLRQRAGDDAGYRAWLQTAAERDPDGYYGLRATALLGLAGADLATPRQLPAGATDPAGEQSALAAWYSSLSTDRTTAESAVRSDPGYQRVELLLELGLHDQVSWEVDALAAAYQGDLSKLTALATLLSDQNEPGLAYGVAGVAVTKVTGQGQTVPAALLRLLYPIPYPNLTLPLASQHGIDPLLFVALMRQESAFDRTAQSPAGALGLTQVMPATGQDIARTLGQTGFTPQDLLRPTVSIEFGMVYLANALQRYGGQIDRALAAYNAGDGAVRGWLSTPGVNDPDVFVERIPYPETHDYVQRVYANYIRYIMLYSAPGR